MAKSKHFLENNAAFFPEMTTSSPTEPVRAYATESVILTCLATAAEGVDIKWRKKAAEYTEENKSYTPLSAQQDEYDSETGTRKSSLTLSSLQGADTSDSIECYDEVVGISGFITLEVLGKQIGDVQY